MVKRILITGVGGPAAQGTMRALRRRSVEFYAGDIDPNAAGLYTVPAGRRCLLLPGVHPRFVEHTLEVCQEKNIDILWPTCDAELIPLALNRGLFEAAGIRLVLPDLSTLRLCLDKWKLYEACRFSVPCPYTQRYTPEEASRVFKRRCVLKPRSGSGSRGIHLINGPEQLAKVGPLDHYIVQDLMPGDEYSVDVFVSADASEKIAVPRLRSKVDSGIAVTSETIHDPQIQEMALLVAEKIKLRGVANIQFKMSETGSPNLLEVNPRVAGTMILTVKAGVNLPALALDDVLGRRLKMPSDFRELAVVRMHREHYVPREEMRAMREQSLAEWEDEPCAPHSAA